MYTTALIIFKELETQLKIVMKIISRNALLMKSNRKLLFAYKAKHVVQKLHIVHVHFGL